MSDDIDLLDDFSLLDLTDHFDPFSDELVETTENVSARSVRLNLKREMLRITQKENLRDAIGAVFYFSGAGSALIQRVAGAFWALYDGVTRSVKAISNAIMAGDWSAAFAVLWTGIKALFAEGWNWIVQTAAECAGLITQWFYQAFESIVGSEIASWFADAFGQIMDVFSMVTHFLMEAWSVAQAFIMNGITLAAAFFMNTWSHVQEFFTVWFVRLSGLFNLLFGWIVNIGKTVLSTIGNVIGWTIARIGDVIKIIGNVISFVSGLLKPLFSLIMTVAVPVFNFLKSGFLTFVDALLWGFGKAWDLISGLVGMVANLAKWAIGFFDWLTGVDGKVKKIADEAEAARTKRSQNAADTVASRNAQPANQGSATDQWEKTLAGIEAGQNPEKQTEQMAGNLLDGLDGMMNPENFEIPKLEEFEPVPVESGAVPITFDDSALKEWEGALARANAAEPPTKVEIPGINTDRANRMGGILNTDHGGEVQKLSSSGTFSAFSAAALGNDVQKNIAENTEQMVTVLKDIRRRGNAGFQFT